MNKEKKRNIIAVLLAIAVAGLIIAADIHISRKAAKPQKTTTIHKVVEKDSNAIVSYRYAVTEPTEKNEKKITKLEFSEKPYYL